MQLIKQKPVYTFVLGNRISVEFQPVSFRAGHFTSFPVQETQSFCALHFPLSTGSQTPGWVILVVLSGRPPFGSQVQFGSPKDGDNWLDAMMSTKILN